MRAVISPRQLHGTVKAPASKSVAHRMLICAAFADKPTDIVCRELSRDIEATADCLREMGAGVSYDGAKGIFHITPWNCKAVLAKMDKIVHIDVGESGSTLRFILPVAAALGLNTHITMHGRLSERPLSPLWEELAAHGARLNRNTDGSIDVSGRLTGSRYTIAADISSQFISGLLFAAPLIRDKDGDFELELTGNIESIDYIRMTIDAMRDCGVEVWQDGNILKVERSARYISPGALEVEGDWSNGAFWICAAAMTEDALCVTGLRDMSTQGDQAVKKLRDAILSGRARVKQAPAANASDNGASKKIQETDAEAENDKMDKIADALDVFSVPEGLQGADKSANDMPCIIDARNVPDLVPVLSVLAASVKGETVFTHAERLRIKESDRIKATVDMLKSLGADAKETADGLKVRGTGERLKGGTIDSCNDHRIAMSAAVASIICKGNVTVTGAEAVRKSYPAFWEDFRAAGGCVSLVEGA